MIIIYYGFPLIDDAWAEVIRFVGALDIPIQKRHQIYDGGANQPFQAVLSAQLRGEKHEAESQGFFRLWPLGLGSYHASQPCHHRGKHLFHGK